MLFFFSPDKDFPLVPDDQKMHNSLKIACIGHSMITIMFQLFMFFLHRRAFFAARVKVLNKLCTGGTVETLLRRKAAGTSVLIS